ncbi:hypothetical protein [Phycicoccus sonneratiae]|uniref:NlpC/P60 family protein n=1 Tax=Phycicoccus sonneratiae TaxID=2807628 RepID=A0ABS2CPU1_9MICO|nr:hypothetical protein [Phycicoccus sonneraticus]MBM6401907.1 hypothetical protein [Phycicoccus sonneraticus]
MSTLVSRRTALSSTLLATGGAILLAPAAEAAPGDPIKRSDVMDRARNWVNRNVQYDQKATAGGPDGVYRWRTDCSGFVSMALKLGPTGIGCPNTTSLAGSTHSTGIAKADLKAGDYLVRSGVHCVLFQMWGNAAKTTLWVFELGSPSTDMNHRKANLSEFSSYTARRARNIRNG